MKYFLFIILFFISIFPVLIINPRIKFKDYLVLIWYEVLYLEKKWKNKTKKEE